MAWHVGCCYRRLESPESRILLPAWDPQTLIPLESALVATSISDLEISWELLDGTRVAARGRGTGSNNPPGAAIRIASAPQQWQGQPGTRIHISLPSEQSPAARQEPTGRVLVVQRSSRPAIQLEERSPKPIRGNEGRLQGGPGPTVPLSGAGREIATLQFPLEIQAPIGCALSASPSLTTLGRGARVSTELSNRTSTAINSEIRLTLHPASGTSATVSTTRMLLAPGASERFETSIRAIDLPRGASYVLAGIQSPLGVEIRSCLIHRTTGKAAWIRYKNESAESTRFWDGGISELPGGPISFVSLAGLEEIAIPRPVPNTIPVDREDDHARLAAPAVGMLATATLDGIQADTFTKTAAENQGVMLYRKEWGRLPQSVGSSLEWTAYPGGLVRAQWRIGSPELCEIRNNELSLRISTPESWDQVVWNRAALWDHYPRNHPDAIEGTTSFPVQLSDVVRAVFKGTRGCMALLTGSDRLNLAAEPSWLTIRLPISASEGLSGSLRVEFGFFPLQDPDAAAGLWAWKPSFVSVYPADA